MTKAPLVTITQEGDPVLRAKAKPVSKTDIGSKTLADIITRMNTALEREHDGVAIAAPQIGVSLCIFIVSRRAFLVENEQKKEKGLKEVEVPETNMVVINPEIVKLSKKKLKVAEGCLSVRWLYGNMRRHEKATIKGLDESGKPFTYGGSGLIAQIFQHETDHLNGVLFIDNATELEKLTAEEIAEFEKQAKAREQK